MCRFPKQVLLVKGQMLYQDYLTECLINDTVPDFVKIDRVWLQRFMSDYRITSRIPNRKFKVARWVLSERLEIFWLSVAKIRKFIMLKFGYDPDCRNIDQSPFHMNEAGSKEVNSLAFKGAPTVPLIESHAATRERWSLNSVTMSSTERIRRRLPGFEIMFTADGHAVEGELQHYVYAKGLLFKVTVVTGPKGSYREDHIIQWCENHLEQWPEGRRWEVMFLDAYAPGLTDNVQRCCYMRGYILITHGGGASMVAQTNDTDHHLWVRKSFIEKQTNLVMRKARSTGGGICELSRFENIDVMIEVMSDLDLHLRAAKGYKYTGTTNNIDGSEDHLICREAKTFWVELNMREKINSAVADVEAQFEAGELPFDFPTIQSLIGSYPPRKQLDVLLPGQEDEATPDPDEFPWDPDPDETLEADDDENQNGGACSFELDPNDWLEPPCDPSGDHHGNGEGQSGASGEICIHGVGATLSEDQVSDLQEQSSRFQTLHQAETLCKEVSGAVGVQLCETIQRVRRREEKSFHHRIQGNAAVDKAMRDMAQAEEAAARRQRADFQAECQRKRSMRAEIARVQRLCPIADSWRFRWWIRCVLDDRFRLNGKRSEEEHHFRHVSRELVDFELDLEAEKCAEAGIAITVLGIRRPSPHAPA